MCHVSCLHVPQAIAFESFDHVGREIYGRLKRHRTSGQRFHFVRESIDSQLPARSASRFLCSKGQYPTHNDTSLYEVLGVSPNASQLDIKVAFRRIARVHHPDVRSDQSSRSIFKNARRAYAVLSDTDLRERYRLYGLDGIAPRSNHHTAPWQSTPSWLENRSGVLKAERGEDVMALVLLDFHEAALGAEKLIRVKVMRECEECRGCTSAPARVRLCGGCHGLGTTWRRVSVKAPTHLRSSAGWRDGGGGHGPDPAGPCEPPQISGSCPFCGGSGLSAQQWCRRCGGEGRSRTQQTLRVSVPAGVDASRVLRIRGVGDVGLHGGNSGDVYVVFRINRAPNFLAGGPRPVFRVELVVRECHSGRGRGGGDPAGDHPFDGTPRGSAWPAHHAGGPGDCG
eukprot:jgi/Botrbrau1/13200/Bobra.0351s0013.1